VRIEHLSIEAFGGLAGVDSGDVPLAPLVVLHGPNEAGKSTFFELLGSLLYGFYPASRDAHPYAPRTGATAEARARIRLSDDRTVEIHRRLLSSPVATLVVEGAEENLRNRTLPMVEHVPRTVFRQVFALTLAELAGLEGESWAAVQDRLMGGLGARDLRPIRAAIEHLEAEAGKLWRPTRHGNQRVRDLDARIRDLRVSKHDAGRLERDIRQRASEVDDLRLQLEQLREVAHESEIWLERHRALLPVRDALRRIRSLADVAGQPEELDGLPADPAARLSDLEERASDAHLRVERLEDALAEPRARIEAHHENDVELVRRRPSIERYVERVVAAEATRLRRAQLDQEVRDLERRIAQRVGSIFGVDVTDEVRTAVGRIAVPALRDAVQRAEEARADLDRLDAATEPAAPSGPVGALPLALTAGLTAAGIALLVVGWGGGMIVAVAAGSFLLATGVLLEVQRRREAGAEARSARARAEQADRISRMRAEASDRLQMAEGDIDRLLDDVGLDGRSGRVGADTPAEVERLQELLRDREDRRAGLREIAATLDELERDGERFRGLPGIDAAADPVALSQSLPVALRRAERRAEDARAARRETDRIERELEVARADAALATRRLDELRERLLDLGGGDVERGAEVATSRLSARDRSRRLRDELEQAHPDLERLERRIAEAEASGEAWTVQDGEVERRTVEQRRRRDRIEELATRVVALEAELERLRERETLDEVDGRIDETSDERARLAFRRDRLWTLARILREAERRVREEHQPGILRDAGGYLARLTGGRYDRLLLDGRDGRTFLVRGPASPEPAPIEAPLSTGTREQIYFALRLALLDQLDRAGERLPLFLDEVFVNWDAERRNAGLGLLAEVAESRQIFLFTCHPEMAEAATRVGATKISLPQLSESGGDSSADTEGVNPSQRSTGSAG
jgi:uncharacterized protein YhaN